MDPPWARRSAHSSWARRSSGSTSSASTPTGIRSSWAPCSCSPSWPTPTCFVEHPGAADVHATASDPPRHRALHDAGWLYMDGQPVTLASPRDALDRGIATVYQDLAVLPLMSISRNFFIGSEPTVGWGPLRRFDVSAAGRIATDQMLEIGIKVRDPSQLVGTLSGGERQTLAIARAEYFGARVLILDEPTSALGVKEAAIVLRHIIRARSKGLGVIFITHNVQHALPVGDRFTILAHGRLAG